MVPWVTHYYCRTYLLCQPSKDDPAPLPVRQLANGRYLHLARQPVPSDDLAHLQSHIYCYCLVKVVIA